jgi:metallophosphoesterase (TIGR00282 family)
MDVNLLIIGDVVGSPGQAVLREGLEALIPAHKIDCVIVNAENADGGSGLTASTYQKIIRSGVDIITLGDHIYRWSDVIPVLEKESNIVKPANLPPTAPGKDFAVVASRSNNPVAVVSVLGRLFMKLPTDCPYRTMDRVLRAIPREVKIIVVDMHAEATSEKVAMGWHLDGRVSVVVGTHTHIPTADERVLPKGTAYITDLGMTGPYDSVLGRRKDKVLGVLLNAVPARFDVAKDDPRMCGVIVTVDTNTGRASKIERVMYRGKEDVRT